MTLSKLNEMEAEIKRRAEMESKPLIFPADECLEIISDLKRSAR